MIDGAHASHRAVSIDTDQQINTATVTLGRDDRQYHRDDLAVSFGAIGVMGSAKAQMGIIINAEAVGEQIVIVLLMRKNLVQGAQLHPALGFADAFGGALLGNCDHTDGRHGEQSENDTVAQYRAAGRGWVIHAQSVLPMPRLALRWP